MKHQARKRFGQNFLIDEQIVDRILRAINPQAGDAVVEIGPGQGALTRPLLERLQALHVIEIDRDLAAELRAWNEPRLHILEADALRVDYASEFPVAGGLRVVGNLPYNISTPLLFHLLSCRAVIRDLHFLLQKEVVDRMAAGPGNGTYGRLSVMMQYHCEVESLFRVPPEAFRPRPKVDSRIVRLVPRAPEVVVTDPACLERIVRVSFTKRRKTLRNCLRDLADEALIESAGLTAVMRPEEVPVVAWARLANLITAQQDTPA